MKRAALNGSPRGISSNSALILEWTVAGMRQAGADEVPIVSLARNPEAALAAFLAADEVVVAFPLYTDFMPGLLKEFLDSLVDIDPAVLRGKRVAWIVHSGFPESIHGETTASWLLRATERLGMKCLGVLIKGGSEGLRLMPLSMTRKTRDAFSSAGESLVRASAFDAQVARALAGRRKFSLPGLLVMLALKPTGLVDMYWNMMLKKHGAMARRFDAPYGEAFDRRESPFAAGRSPE